MNRRYILFFVFMFLSFSVWSQMYILNEDFTGTSGTTPPGGWSNVIISGVTGDSWHFDNPGQRIVNYPVLEPYAIFDSEELSANGEPEEVALETPLFDASSSNFILLQFQHFLQPGTGGTARVLAYDGDDWQEVAIFSGLTSNPSNEVVDLSPAIGGITNARLRFVWSGNGSGFWALDNIRIYAAQPLDGGVVSIDNPTSPLDPGIQDVTITLGNFGYNTITSTTVNWTANGVPQPPHNWAGSLGFGQTQGNIVIGSYDFQVPVVLKVWQTSPNGGNDPNPYNDTITKRVEAALCGTYTIGGNNPDFNSFSEVATTLNLAGVTCPVTFRVRDGVYYEQFILGDIPGASETNTITFESESGNSSQALIHINTEALKYEPMIYMDATRYVTFKNLGFVTGSEVSYANVALEINGATTISFEGCYFEVRNQFDFGIDCYGGSQDISMEDCYFESINGRAGAMKVSGEETRDIHITGNEILGAQDWGYNTVWINSGCKDITLTGNTMERCYRAILVEHADSVYITGNNIENSNEGAIVEDGSNIEISGNRFTGIKSHQNVQQGTSAVALENTQETSVYNNFIHTTGDGTTRGITLLESVDCQVHFNSVNITSTDGQGASTGIYVEESSGITGRNNIFQSTGTGPPITLDAVSTSIDLDRNDYFSYEGAIGYYAGTRYTDLSSWVGAVGMDINSLSTPPFFTSMTDLAINQALLNNTGEPVMGIVLDIDGIPRDPVAPDIGAKEYSPCTHDAGVNAITAPQNPLAGGTQQVRVLLQNQGSASLIAATINWSVNGEAQPSFPWSGNLGVAANVEVGIGNYNFQAGILYVIEAWTAQPNGTEDCNPLNDTIRSEELAVPLCGSYTIGGNNPDFTSFRDVVFVLNLAGVSCPVTFLVRDGLYKEKFTLRNIPGASETNTVTFRSENGDSTQAVLQIPAEAQKNDIIALLQGTENVFFQDLGFLTGSDAGSENSAFMMLNAENIRVGNCYFETRKEADMAMQAIEGSQDIHFLNNHVICVTQGALALRVSDEGTGNIVITDNYISGATGFNTNTLRVEDHANGIVISGNRLENCFKAISLSNSNDITVSNNVLSVVNYGIHSIDFCSNVTVSGNHLSEVRNSPETTEGISAIHIQNTSQSIVFNNFIHTAGNGPVKGITLQTTTDCGAYFNSVNITSNDQQGRNKGVNMKDCNPTVVKNNIFNIASTGIPVFIEGNNTGLDLDRNDYFSYNGTIGSLDGTQYFNLSEWSAATAMDANSVSAPPFFTSDTDPGMNQVLLNDAGLPVNGITTDIDGTPRDPQHPDLGAREYTPCADDAGINMIIDPQNPLSGGTENVNVQLQNHGTAPLSSVSINWSVNEVAQTAFEWTGNLVSGENTVVTIGSYDFQLGNVFRLKTWTALPNGTADCNPLNDTATERELISPLCGTYTIGGEDPDFPTLTKAAAALAQAGIGCPVTFLVRDGVYYEQFVLEMIMGSSQDNTITFAPENAGSQNVEIRIKPEALKFESIIYLKGSQHITFEGLDFYTGSSVGDANSIIRLEGAGNIIVRDCYMKTLKNNDFGMIIESGSHDVEISGNKIECVNLGSEALDIADAGTHHILISNNTISGSPQWDLTILRIGSGASHVELSGNTIEECYRAVYALGVDSMMIRDNLLRRVNDGIYIGNNCSGVEIAANRILNAASHPSASEGTSGIFAQGSGDILVVNNFVHTTGTGPSRGITLMDMDTCTVWFNSVHVTNTDGQARSRGMHLANVEKVLGRNNIFSVKSLGIPLEISQQQTDIAMDYNNYYQPAGIVGKLEGTTFTSLTEWGQTTQGDANSKVVNPFFKADTIPLPFQRDLNGAGIPIPGILYDIDGKLRFSQAPDIGCLEFFVDYGVLDLLSPTLSCFHPEVDTVIVHIRQYGDVPFNDLKVAYQMNDGPVHIDTIPGPHIEDVIHSFNETENLTTYGDYLFKIWLINTLDDNINNDTLYAWRYSKPSPEPNFTYDNFCTGPLVYFFGEATVPEPYFIEGYEWLFGDGETSTEQNPSHFYQEPGTYQVELRAYSDAGCYGEIILPVYINPNFVPLTLDYNVVDETCYGDGTASIEIIRSGGYPPVNLYLNGEALVDTLVTGLTTGQYVIEAIDAENCVVTDTIDITSEIFMNPQIVADPLTGNAPLTVDFSFTADGAADWLWRFPGEVTDTSRAPQKEFKEYGSHIVFLDVVSGHPHYCMETDTVEIFVDVIISIEANNVFTPNGDGVNDYFEIITTGIRDLEANIYNLWGNRVYKMEGLESRWDGNTSGGAKVPDGTYFWTLEADGSDNMVHTRQGSVLLLRHAAEAIPNPVRDRVQVKVYDQLEPPVEVQVFSAYGQQVHEAAFNDDGSISLNLSALSPGIYFIKVTDDNGNYSVRIIKN